MKGITNFFTEKYKDLVNKLIIELYEKFENTTDVEERIKMLYPHLQCITITPGIYGKSLEDAQKAKCDGNAYFTKCDNNNALNCYSVGVIKCPQHNVESRKLLAILVANRSACLYDLKEYERTLNDIRYVTELKVYPEHLKYKLYHREAKCHSQIKNNQNLASASYKLALDYLDISTLDKTVIQKKKQEIQVALKNIANITKIQPQIKIDAFESNPKFPGVKKSVVFDYDPKLGRFARAVANIEVGSIIVKELPHCAVLSFAFALKNCQHCTKSTDAPIPCEKCANVCFCSLRCKTAAACYHQYECGLHPTISESGASINCLMALRIITQNSVNYFESVIKNIETTPEVHTYNNYACVYKLCRNEHMRKTKEYFHYTIISIYLLRLLKTSTYFNKIVPENKLTEDEVFICKLILHNLELLQFNAHEISELHEAPPGPLDPQDEPNFKAVYIGGGIYPTLAFFNHSCDPSIVRYNIGTEMIVKAIKPIKKGEIIYENYGPIYTNTIRSERQKNLLENYWFECTCQACDEDWPLFKDMEENVIKIPCKNSKCQNFFNLNENIENPTISCDFCSTITNLFPYLKALAELENILPKAEELYKINNYEKAMELYLRAMNIYSKNTVPPFPDWVKVQQRLRTCIVSFGNKCIDYSKLKFIK
ncbi:hypothetical protein RN001_015682 [Aquatica leii]|uniref:Protein-lysine N-methyltransferase SMYD4 n=1 Tax=Aquatica leii TaxID=1421715 RepID=A0AAN7SK07_9COLE|nr:hypothetical protein RN001_015682 [Aquatica leii]